MDVNIILCTDKEGGISKNGVIPWKIQEDTHYFYDTITRKINNYKNVIVMGRKTFSQMGLVKNSINIIFSNSISIDDLDVGDNNEIYIIHSMNDYLNTIKSLDSKYGKIFICGGTDIYNMFINDYFNHKNITHINLYWTKINKVYHCDNFINLSHMNHFTSFEYDKLSYDCYDIKNNNEHVDVIFNFPKHNGSVDNNEEHTYLEIMDSLITSGHKTQGRNGITYSKFGNMMKFNLESFPLLTTKKVFFKGVFEELMFFIRGQTNTNILANNGIKIWEKNTTREFLDNNNLDDYEQGDMGPMYGFQWRHFNAEYSGMNINYAGKGYDQLKFVLNELKHNPTSRRILMTTYNPEYAHQGVLFPCHGIAIQFHTEKMLDGVYRLNISQNQRSCDFFLGIPFNIASYALLNYIICDLLNNDVECSHTFYPGELTMFLGDYHLYESHLVQAKRQVLRIPTVFPKLKINNIVTEIEDYKFSDFDLVNYNSYPNIAAEMVA